MTQEILKGLGHMMQTNFPNNNFEIFLMGHITEISTTFLKMKVLF